MTISTAAEIVARRQPVDPEVAQQAGNYLLSPSGVRTELVEIAGGELREDPSIVEARLRIMQNSVEAPFGD